MPLFPNRFDYGFNAGDRTGILAESFQAQTATGGTATATAGRLELVKLKLLFPASVTNIIMGVVTVGNTLTAGQCFAALYTGAGALVGVTADQAAAWVSTGVKTMALASGPFTMAAGYCYVGFWYNGTTAPAMLRAGDQLGHSECRDGHPNLLHGSADTGLTTTAPATFGAQTVQGTMWWAALS